MMELSKARALRSFSVPEFDWSFIEKTCLADNGSCVSS